MEIPVSESHSADGAWWWSGDGWLPAWSLDRRLWFDGRSWRPTGPDAVGRPTGVEIGIAVGIFATWVLSVAWSVAALPPTVAAADLSSALDLAGLGLLAAWFGGTVVSGLLLGFRGRWAYVGFLVAYVWTLVLAWYVSAMLMTPADSGSDNDTAAGAGLVILAVPTLLAVVVLTTTGAGLGALARTVSQRRRSPRRLTTEKGEV